MINEHFDWEELSLRLVWIALISAVALVAYGVFTTRIVYCLVGGGMILVSLVYSGLQYLRYTRKLKELEGRG